MFGLWIQKAKSAGSTELIYLQNGHFILQLGFLFCWKSQFVDNFHGDFSSAFTMNTWSRKRKKSCTNARCVYFELKWDYFINYLFIYYYLISQLALSVQAPSGQIVGLTAIDYSELAGAEDFVWKDLVQMAYILE